MSKTSTEVQTSWKAVLCGSVTASATALIGGILFSFGEPYFPYGLTMFLALPVVTGLVASCFTRPLAAILLTTKIAIILCFLGLLFTGLEGIVCIFMAAPLIFAGAGIGAGFGWLVRKLTNSRVNLILIPLVGLSSVFAAGQAEERLGTRDRTETVVSTQVVKSTPETVWDAIIAVDGIYGRKPFLLRIGLPVPRRCTLDGNGVGAKRTCHFDSGVIEEEIVNWDPPHHVSMKIVRATIPGRHWLRFETASYKIEQIGPHETLVARTTTIASKLRPGWYWRFFERIGVQAEHRYLFDSLFSRQPDTIQEAR